MLFLSTRCALVTCVVFLCTRSIESFSTRNNLIVPARKQVPAASPAFEKNKRWHSTTTVPMALPREDDVERSLPKRVSNDLKRASILVLVSASILASPVLSLADEIGREVEAPTLFTGEALEICVKRGPLGACTKTEVRTAENNNDKAEKYFVVKEKSIRQTSAENYDDEDIELVKKLRQKTVENKEKNEQAVMIKTFENNQSANFGPFDRQVLIMNTDSKTFTLLQNPQAMRLKKAGYIEGRKFVNQPSQEVIDRALEADETEGFGGFIKGLFSGGD